MTVGSAVTAPAWQAVVPQLVPKPDLPAAVAANSVGINVSRAVGPALGGILVGAFGIAAPFWVNAFSNIGVIAALVRWRPPEKAARACRPKPSATRCARAFGTRDTTAHLRCDSDSSLRRSSYLRSAYWALLPLVARSQIAGGPALYGLLLGAIGASAVGGALLLRQLRVKLGADRLVAAATLATSAATALFALAHDAVTAVAASLIAGASWIAAVSSLNVSAQVALPEWVRGRGLAMYVTVMFGALTIGSAMWGELAAIAGLPAALLARRRRRRNRDPADLAMEITDGRERRFFAVDALAGAGHRPRDRTGPGTGPRDDRIPHRSQKPTNSFYARSADTHARAAGTALTTGAYSKIPP